MLKFSRTCHERNYPFLILPTAEHMHNKTEIIFIKQHLIVIELKIGEENRDYSRQCMASAASQNIN